MSNHRDRFSSRPSLSPLETHLAPAASDLDLTFAGDGVAELVGIQRISLAPLPDGRIVVAGTLESEPGHKFVVVRLHADGTPDATFGKDGRTVLPLTSADVGLGGVAGVAAMPDGRIVVAGTSDSNFAVARYLPDGSLDPTFDGDGVATHGSAPGGTWPTPPAGWPCCSAGRNRSGAGYGGRSGSDVPRHRSPPCA